MSMEQGALHTIPEAMWPAPPPTPYQDLEAPAPPSEGAHEIM